MLYISVEFHENVLNGFQLIEWTGNDNCQNSKGNNSKNVLIRVVVGICMLSDDFLYFYEGS